MSPSNGKFPLSSEILLHIFCHLPFLSEIFALAATCSRLRAIWSVNVTPIYNTVASRSIPCLQHARRFLADQGGPGCEALMPMGDAVRMAGNANVVEKALLQFEREIVSRVRSKCSTTAKVGERDSNIYLKADPYSAQELQAYYDVRAGGHPPTLTRTERPRFILSYYTLWSLMKLDAPEWESRLEYLTSQQLYYLHEMTN